MVVVVGRRANEREEIEMEEVWVGGDLRDTVESEKVIGMRGGEN